MPALRTLRRKSGASFWQITCDAGLAVPELWLLASMQRFDENSKTVESLLLE
jgi:hypothetical protein